MGSVTSQTNEKGSLFYPQLKIAAHTVDSFCRSWLQSRENNERHWLQETSSVSNHCKWLVTGAPTALLNLRKAITNEEEKQTSNHLSCSICQPLEVKCTKEIKAHVPWKFSVDNTMSVWTAILPHLPFLFFPNFQTSQSSSLSAHLYFRFPVTKMLTSSL